MSSTLYWEPVIRKGKCLSDGLKFILQKKYGPTINSCLDYSDINYLDGVADGARDANIKTEIQQLIFAIEKHGAIKLYEEF